MDGRDYSNEDQLFPPLSNQDRHPSAPLLHSMLSSGIMTHTQHQPIPPKDITNVINDDMLGEPARSRSWSMPVNTARPPLPPQISISSPDEPQDIFCK